MGTAASADERERKTLKERAARLAIVPEATPGEGETVHAVRFRSGGETCAVERRYVREVLPLPCVTPLPGVPAFVRGIMNVRGRIVSVLDLSEILGLPDTVEGAESGVVILQSTELEFALLADEILGLAAIPLSSIHPPPPTLTKGGAEYLKGVTAEGLVLLDAEKMLADRNLVIHEVVGRVR
jgi:purine-binding chemotaxis protein CheW